MKTFSAGLAAHYALSTQRIATCFELQRVDPEGTVTYTARFTSLDRDLVVSGDTYVSAGGLDQTQITISSGAAVDSAQLTILPDGDDLLESEILAGLWDFARFRLFETNYEDPAGGINTLRRGWTGNATVTRGGFTIELRSLKQAWQQSVGEVTSKTCKARLGDDRCLFDLDGSPSVWKRAYATTAVTDRRVFTCSAAVEASDFYGNGIALGLTGANAGYDQKIASFAAGVFTLSLPMPFTVIVGDTFQFTAGCRNRLLEDCRDKFDNVLNFQGEPHVPGPDALLSDPDVGG